MRNVRLLFAGVAVLALLSAPARAAERTEVDKSIDRGLEFLQRTQDSDGAWHVGNGKDPAITSLCVMAFLSAGHVPGEGRYSDAIERGIGFVLKGQHDNGLFGSIGHYEMYHHGICTLMLAEAAGMAGGKLADDVRQRLEKAVQVILKAQRQNGIHKGGWRYRVADNDGDISVTGWQLMALRAAKNLGCDVPPEAIDMAVDYVKRCHDPVSGGFRYQPGGRTTVACTGTSILALELGGKNLHHAPESLKGGAFLIKNPPRWEQNNRFFYSIYYCSQATFQLGGNYWSFYRPQLHDMLLKNQSGNGSWGVSDGVGPNYGTAMAILSLTPEYRFLPIYQRGEEPAEQK